MVDEIELTKEELAKLEKPIEVKVIEEKKEVVEDDLDYVDFDIIDEEIKEFEDGK